MTRLRKYAIWFFPILVVVFITPWSEFLDLEIAQWAYTHYWGISHTNSSYQTYTRFLEHLYDYGCLPAQIVCAASGIIFLLSWKYRKLTALRGPCLVIGLSLVIGSGLIAHSILKEWWGRPRPRQITQFGGSQPFRPYYMPATTRPPHSSKSFPSGHATTGFYFLAFYFVGKRANSRKMQFFGIAFGLLFGGLLSIARILQGGHFFSDTLLAALIMWLSAWLSDYLVYRYQSTWMYANKKTKRSS